MPEGITVLDTVEIVVTPTLTVHSAYASGDYVGTSGSPMTFPGAAHEAGQLGKILAAILYDQLAVKVACELWLFNGPITPPADSAAWSISDADAAKLVAVIAFSTYFASALNAIAQGVIPNGLAEYKSSDGNLYGCLVTRGAPTYAATGDLIVKLLLARE